jgi:hypothetical protein
MFKFNHAGNAVRFSAAILLSSIMFLTGCGSSTSSSTSSDTDTSTSTDTGTDTVTAQENTEISTDETGHYEVDLGAGNYTAGIDLPSGSYNLSAVSGSGNVSSSNMYSGGLNEIMGTDTSDGMTVNTFNSLQMDDGVVLSIGSTAVIHLTSEDAMINNVTGRAADEASAVDLGAGNYTAGIDFPAGTYTITATGGSGNVSSDNMFDGGLNEIMSVDTNDGFSISQFSHASFPDGTVLTISGTSVHMVPES